MKRFFIISLLVFLSVIHKVTAQVEAFSNTGKISFPVSLQLLSFNAAPINNQALLQWNTTNELNASRFIIERSRTGINYTIIGSVNAFNTSNSHSYSFTDESKLSNIVYYRLKVIDSNDNFIYSDVKVIRNVSVGISVSTDPVKNSVTVTYPVAGENAFIKLMDIKGVEVFKKPVPAATTLLLINTSLIAAGEYLLSYANGNACGTVKFIKQ